MQSDNNPILYRPCGHKKTYSVGTSPQSKSPCVRPASSISPTVVSDVFTSESPKPNIVRSPSIAALEQACSDVELPGFKNCKLLLLERGIITQHSLLNKIMEKKIELGNLKYLATQKHVQDIDKIKEIFVKYYLNRHNTLLDEVKTNVKRIMDYVNCKGEAYNAKYNCVKKYFDEEVIIPDTLTGVLLLMNNFDERIDNIRYVLEYVNSRSSKLAFSINFLKEYNKLISEEIEEFKNILELN